MAKKWIAAAVVTVILIGLLWPFDGESHGRLYEEVWRFLHFPALFAATWGLRRLLAEARFPVVARGWLIASLCAVPLLEAAQSLTGRTPAWGDVLMGWAGVLAAGALIHGWINPRRRRARVICGSAAALLLAAMVPIISVSVDQWMARRAFPLLASFRTPFEVGRFEAQSAVLSRSSRHAAYGKYSLAIALRNEGEYPGLFMTDFRNDWSDTDQFHVVAWLEGDQPLHGWLRMDDKPFPEYADRYQQPIELRPGDNLIHVDLGSAFRTPRGRAMQKEFVHRWGLFFDQDAAGRVLYLDAVYLTRTGVVGTTVP